MNGIITCIMAFGGIVGMIWSVGGIIVEVCVMFNVGGRRDA